MPKPPVPESVHDLLTGRHLGHLATVDASGQPQVNPVWFLWEDGRLLLSVLSDTNKYRNLRGNPNVAMSVLDPANSGRSIELRGHVVDLELYLDLTFVNRLAQKYTGADFSAGKPGQERYKVTIEVDRWTGG